MTAPTLSLARLTENGVTTLKAPPLAYCDYIAHRIQTALSGNDPERIISGAGRVEWDLHPTGGYMLTTKKTILVTDRNGRKYRVTVEEVRP